MPVHLLSGSGVPSDEAEGRGQADHREAHLVPSDDAGQGCGGTLPEDPDNAARVSRSTVRDRAVLRTRRHG